MFRRPLILLALAAFLAPGLFAQNDPQSLEEALEQMRKRIAEMQGEGKALERLQSAFGEVEAQHKADGTIPLPKITGKAGPGGASGSVGLPGVSVRGSATEQGAVGTVNVGGIKVRGSATEGGAGGTISIPGLGTMGGKAGPGGVDATFAGPAGKAAYMNLGQAFGSANRGGLYAASLFGLRGSLVMLKAYGQPTADIEAELVALEPQLKVLDALSMQIMGYTSKNQVPPEALTKSFDAKSKQVEPRLQAIGSKIEVRSEAMARAMEKQVGAGLQGLQQMMQQMNPQGAGAPPTGK